MLVDLDVGSWIARTIEQIPSLVNELAFLDPLPNAAKERLITDQHGEAGVAPILVPKRKSRDLTILERRGVANVLRGVRRAILPTQLPEFVKGATDLFLSRTGLVGGRLHVNRRVTQVRTALVDSVAGRIEDMPVALLNRDRDLVLGLALQLPNLLLLVFRQVGQALGLDQSSQRQSPTHLASHLLLLGFVGDHECQMVPIHPHARVVDSLLGIDALDQCRHLLDSSPYIHAVIGHHGEFRPPVTNLVRHFVRSAGKMHRVKYIPLEDVPDAVVEFDPQILVLDVPFLVADHLVQIRLDVEAQWGTGPVV